MSIIYQKKGRVFIFYFIPQYIEINSIYVWRGTKGFGFKTLIAPLCKLFLESAVFDYFTVYASTYQVQEHLPNIFT